jgi:hypothetical protein
MKFGPVRRQIVVTGEGEIGIGGACGTTNGLLGFTIGAV